MKVLILGIMIVALLAMGYQFFNLYQQYGLLRVSAGKISVDLQKLKTENGKLANDIGYFSDPENLAKEFRSKFNYKKPGEKMTIVVP